MTCLIYSLLSWLYRGIETEEKIQKRLRNAQAELDQSNSPGLFDHLLVNDDLETCYENLKVIHQDHCYLALLLFYNSRLQLGSSSFLNNCYCNLQKLLSLDDDHEDSDDLCKFHELCCLQFALMLQCVFSYSKFCYCQLSRMVNNPQVTVLCPNMTQKFCCNLRLLKPKMELQACMSSCPYFFSTIPCYELMGWCLHLFLYLNFSTD